MINELPLQSLGGKKCHHQGEKKWKQLKKLKTFLIAGRQGNVPNPKGFHQDFSIHFIFVSLLAVSGGLWEVFKPQGPELCRVPYFANPSVASIACANTGQMLTADFNPNFLSPLHFKNPLHGQRTILESTQLST